MISLRAGLESRYRLRPDARFLLAVGEIHRILVEGTTDVEPAQAEYRAGRWTIRYRNREAGTLDDLADFSELLRFLSAWAGGLIRQHSIQFSAETNATDEPQDSLRKLDTLDALLRADQSLQGHKRDLGTLRACVQAMTALAAQSLDTVGIAELIPARALALLAIERAQNPSAGRIEECLLAQELGYSRHAYDLAGELPEHEPVRAYVRHEDASLSKAEADGELAAFLHRRRLSERKDLRRWQATATSMPQGQSRLPLLKTGLALGRIESNAQMATGLIAAVTEEMKHWAKAIRQRPEGPLLDRELLKAYYRGFLYSALHELGEHYREHFSSVEATVEFDQQLGSGGLLSAEYRSWFRHLAEAKAGRSKVADLRADLTGLSQFGGPMLFETYEEIKKHLPFADPSLQDVISELTARLDSRPAHRFELAWILYNDLLAIGSGEALAENATKTQHFGNLAFQAWFALLNRDQKRLKELLAQPDLTAGEKSRVLRQLSTENGFAQEWLDEQHALIAETRPELWAPMEAYVDFLEKHKQYAKAQEVAEDWLKRRRTKSLDDTFARTTVARMHHLQGRPAEGLKAINHPDVDSWQFGAMHRKALLLDDLGHHEPAERLAETARERYPDSIEATLLLAELLWKHRKHDAAADVFVRHRYPISASTWRFSVGKRFAEIFKDRPAEALAADEALRKTKLDPLFVGTQFALEIYKAGNPQLAFEIQSRQTAPGLQNLLYKAKAYKFLRDAKGKDTALQWLGQEVPDAMKAPLCMFVLPDRTHELLWEFVPSKLEGSHGAYYWLVRAATFVLDGGDDPEQKRQLEARFAKAEPDHYHIIGRYLLGKASEAELLAEAVDQKKSNEIYYFIGFKAMTEGRYRDAADWFWLTTEIGTMNNGETRWARDHLYLWVGQSKSLRLLAEEHGRSRTEAVVSDKKAVEPAG